DALRELCWRELLPECYQTPFVNAGESNETVVLSCLF
ncbi:MAG: hypothetical protein QOF94_629, partial [Acidobacteriaceae bacterium]